MDDQQRRYFVTVITLDRQRLPALMGMDLDLFGPREGEVGHEIDGLIMLEDVAKLVEAGFLVLVRSTDRRTEEARYIGAKEWLDEMRADLEEQRER
jgi:hypothetical protein